VASGFTGWGLPPELWSVVVIAVAALAGIVLAVVGRGRLSPALSLSWGLAWVAVGRLTGDLVSVPTAVAAIVAVVLVLGVTITLRVTRGGSLPAA